MDKGKSKKALSIKDLQLCNFTILMQLNKYNFTITLQDEEHFPKKS